MPDPTTPDTLTAAAERTGEVAKCPDCLAPSPTVQRTWACDYCGGRGTVRDERGEEADHAG